MTTTNDYIRIVGNNVEVIRESVVKKVLLTDFIANLESNMKCSTGLLPRNCKYATRGSNGFVYVIEIPAQVICAKYKNASSADTSTAVKEVALSIPFTQFYISGNPSTGAIGTIFITVTKRPIDTIGLSGLVCVAPYPNIFDEGVGRVCTGSMSIPSDIPLANKLNVICSNFFEAEFNNDLRPHMPACISARDIPTYIKKWADKTAANRMFMVSDECVFTNHPQTPNDIIERLCSFSGAR